MLLSKVTIHFQKNAKSYFFYPTINWHTLINHSNPSLTPTSANSVNHYSTLNFFTFHICVRLCDIYLSVTDSFHLTTSRSIHVDITEKKFSWGSFTVYCLSCRNWNYLLSVLFFNHRSDIKGIGLRLLGGCTKWQWSLNLLVRQLSVLGRMIALACNDFWCATVALFSKCRVLTFSFWWWKRRVCGWCHVRNLPYWH